MELGMDTQSTPTNSKQIIAHLSDQFPNCFTIKGDIKPLKIGIFQDIVERLAEDEHFSKTKLRLALRLYTASWRYLYSIKEGVNRVDLDGNACDVVTSEQASHALAQLKESKAKAKVKVQEKSNNESSETKFKAPKPRNSNPKKQGDASSKKTTQPRDVKITERKIDISKLQVGHSVKVLIGSKPVSAIISSIEKDQVKVKVSSGMELTLTAAYILI